MWVLAATQADNIALDTVAQVPRGPAVLPEMTSITQGGIDLGFAGNRVAIGLTLYHERTADLIVAGNAGAANAGALSNRGIQVALTMPGGGRSSHGRLAVPVGLAPLPAARPALP